MFQQNVDWFDQQKIALSNSTVNWNNIAERPGTSAYAAARSSRFDEVHVVVIDDKGTVTGNAGTILEKHLGLSKAKDAEFSAGSPSYWRKYLYNNSTNIFGMGAPANLITSTSFEFGHLQKKLIMVGINQHRVFHLQETVYWIVTLTGGKNYGGGTNYTTAGAMVASLGGITAGYDLFETKINLILTSY